MFYQLLVKCFEFDGVKCVSLQPLVALCSLLLFVKTNKKKKPSSTLIFNHSKIAVSLRSH